MHNFIYSLENIMMRLP